METWSRREKKGFFSLDLMILKYRYLRYKNLHSRNLALKYTTKAVFYKRIYSNAFVHRCTWQQNIYTHIRQTQRQIYVYPAIIAQIRDMQKQGSRSTHVEPSFRSQDSGSWGTVHEAFQFCLGRCGYSSPARTHRYDSQQPSTLEK